MARSTPVRAAPRPGRGATSRHTSSAEPPRSAWMKLACLVETWADPIRSPFSPAASTSRPAESPTGFTNTEPAFGPPAGAPDASARCRSPSARRRPCPPARARTRPTPPPLVSAQRPTSGSRARGAPASASAPRRVATSKRGEARQHRGDVRAVAPGVHPQRAAHRSRHARRPTPGPCSPAAADLRATTGSLAPAPARTVDASTSTQSKPGPRRTTTPGKPASATRRFEPSPSTSSGTATSSDRQQRSVHGDEVVLGGGLDEHAGLAPDAVGGARPERSVALCPVAEHRRDGVERAPPYASAGRGGDGAHHGVVAWSSSGSDVRSPAPRVRHRSPGTSSAATWARSSARPGT